MGRWIVVSAGYDAEFISQGTFAAVDLTLCGAATRQTGPNAAENSGLAPTRGLPQTGEANRQQMLPARNYRS
jgi:hypothetical protein